MSPPPPPHDQHHRENEHRSVAGNTGKKKGSNTASKFTDNRPEAGQLKTIQQLADHKTEARFKPPVQMKDGHFLTGKPPVIQQQNVYAAQKSGAATYNWRSTKSFDTKHYSGANPQKDQEWVDWRLARWPGFGSKQYATLITGDLSQALKNGDYDNYNEDGGNFTLDVTVDCTTVNPLNAKNALTVNNLQKTEYDNVSLAGRKSKENEGKANEKQTYLLNHLSGGF